jgi:hypothetical protein
MSGWLEIPGRMRHNHPGWGPVRVEVLAAESPEQLTAQINLLLDSMECNVLAVSAATTTATFVAEPYIATVALQARVDPLLNGGPS